MPYALLRASIWVEVRRMKTKRLCVAGLSLALLLFALLVASAQAGAAKPQPGKVKRTATGISTLAMDGPRVAYASGGKLYVWNVVTGVTSLVRGRYGNVRHASDAPQQLAFASKRLAWVKRQEFGEAQESSKLYTAPIAGRPRLLKEGHLFHWADSSRTSGVWIGGLIGSGKVLAVSTWKSNGTASSDEQLSLITSTGLRTIVAGPAAIVAASVNGGHIAVLRSTAAWPVWGPATPTTQPTVGVYSTGGKLLREIVLTTPIPPPYSGLPSTIQNSIALSGDRLVVLTVTGSPSVRRAATVEVYDWRTGALVQTWPLQFNPRWLNLASPLAVYGRFAAIEGASLLHLVNLTTGNDDVSIAHANYFSDTGRSAAIGPRGLVYALSPRRYNGPGKLVFVPMAKLLAMESQ
jgi:hypothetical protein